MGITTTLIKQDQISLKIETSLGQDVLIMRTFQGIEGLSSPFEFEVFTVSTNANIDFDTIIGKSVTVSIDVKGKKRYFNGIVGHFSQHQTADSSKGSQETYYKAILYPSFWLLKFKKNNKIFQNKSPLQIIGEILQDNNVIFEKKTTTCGNDPREYCVQYNETDFDFISRLLEEEGIYYYFNHDNGKHTMILGDNPTGHQDCPNIDKAPFEPSRMDVPLINLVNRCEVRQQVVTTSFAMADYNFTNASTKLYSDSKSKRGKEVRKWYTFPGDVDHEDKPAQGKLESLSKLRIEALELPERFIEGDSTIPFFSAGFKFQLEGHRRKDVNKSYILHSIKHSYIIDPARAKAGRAIYSNGFKAFPADTSFRPPLITPKPKIDAQTATVTGPQGEEIFTDKYGRVKVKFHWDRDGKDDDTSSCWLRVRQGMAGNNWGMLFLPRIGQEVIVEFFEGSQNRPFVTGCLYNSTHMPPYLPDRPSKSTIKTNTTKGGNGYNELRFEDLKKEEQIYLHAQKDWDTLILETRTTRLKKGSDWKWIEAGDRNVTILGADGAVAKTTPPDEKQEAGKGDDNLIITKGNRNMTLKGEGKGKGSYNTTIVKGDRVLEIKKGDEKETHDEGNHDKLLKKGNYTLTLNEGDRSVTLNKGNETVTLDQGNQTISLESGDRTVTINGNDTLTVEKDVTMTITGNLTITVEGNISIECAQNINMSAGESITIEAGEAINITAGADISMEAGGDANVSAGGAIEAEAGGDVTIAAGGAAEMTAGGDATIAAGGAAEMTAGGDVAVAAGGAAELDAGGECEIGAASVTILAAVVEVV
jgi:type VI secretion system secreted protein VgrG